MDDADAIERAARMLLTSSGTVKLNTEELDVGRLIQVLARTARLLMFALGQTDPDARDEALDTSLRRALNESEPRVRLLGADDA
jgi:hypothetical protein